MNGVEKFEIRKKRGENTLSAPGSYSKEEKLNEVDVKNLTLTVSAASRAGDVTGNTAPAFRASLKLRLLPAVGTAAEFLLMLGGTTFWSSHDFIELKRLLTAGNAICLWIPAHPERPMGCHLFVRGRCLYLFYQFCPLLNIEDRARTSFHSRPLRNGDWWEVR